ncbi:MAG: aldehyde dehydrogenase [Deltaproteobacteria bacterium]|nr:MAG: aldehyde dehydrogenase [Deltaproteobacteria bacterium]
MSALVSYDPATGEVVGQVEITDPNSIPAMVARAREAGEGWAAMSLTERRDLLLEAGKVIAANAEAIGEQLCREMGKPLREAIGEVRSCAHMADELDEMCEALAPEVIDDGRSRSTLYRDPFGVVAAITPWNFPFSMPHWMVLPSLMAGNAVILKPSEETPLTAQAYVDALNATLPEGVLQIVHGADVQGKALVNADVDLVAFTGSRAAGIHILTAAGQDLKRVILELGGKDPMVVLPGADLPRAASFAARNSFRNAGQVCVSTERIYVHQELYEPFLDALVAETAKLRQGHGLDEGVEIGPMINARQRDWVLRQIDEAVAAGARVLAGGEGHEGNFIRPTVLADVTHEMGIAVDETFGPVACVTPVADDAEALRMANDTPYGLGASVWGETERAEKVARGIRAGMIGINRSCGGAAGTPWVGARQSGYGFHSSKEGHRQFAQVRVLTTVADR